MTEPQFSINAYMEWSRDGWYLSVRVRHLPSDNIITEYFCETAPTAGALYAALLNRVNQGVHAAHLVLPEPVLSTD